MSMTPESNHDTRSESGGADDRWLDRPGNVDRLIMLLIAVSVATVGADFFYSKHGHWHFQEWIGFDAVYGFVACVGLVLAAKVLRILLMRDENYYGDGDEAPPPESAPGQEDGHG
jgi:hypothetical protein